MDRMEMANEPLQVVKSLAVAEMIGTKVNKNSANANLLKEFSIFS